MELKKIFDGRFRLVLAIVGLACFPVGTLIAQPSSASGDKTIFCCELANGQTLCGDVLPLACYGRTYREISPQGTIRRSVEGAISPEEQAKRASAERVRQEEEKRKRAQQQSDQALLATYLNLADIDARRDRQTARIQSEIDQINVRRDALQSDQAKIDEEIARLPSNKEPSADLMNRRLANEDELNSIRRLVEGKQRDIADIRARFDRDRKRYIDLTTGQAGK